MALPGLLKDPTPFLFFTGKGGVGKTSLSTATALALAEVDRRRLLAMLTERAEALNSMSKAGRCCWRI